MAIYPRTFFEANTVAIVPRTCFVIMPFGDLFDEIYNEVIKEALEENNFSVVRADEISGANAIMEDILKGIESAEVVVADLTGRNANVFYELGITHSRKKSASVITITQDLDDIPFDVKPYRCIRYQPTITGAKALRAQLTSTVKEFTLRPFTWAGSEWQPLAESWYPVENGDTLRAEAFQNGQIPLIVNKTPIGKDKFSLSFAACSSGPEVNVMFYFDGENRFSGYHFWFWQSGAKLRRQDDEVKLEKGYKLKKKTDHSIVLNYDKGEISALVDGSQVLGFVDDKPLHKLRRLDFIGFNISGVGHVDLYDLKMADT